MLHLQEIAEILGKDPLVAKRWKLFKAALIGDCHGVLPKISQNVHADSSFPLMEVLQLWAKKEGASIKGLVEILAMTDFITAAGKIEIDFGDHKYFYGSNPPHTTSKS